jgi:hypothetical protein
VKKGGDEKFWESKAKAKKVTDKAPTAKKATGGKAAKTEAGTDGEGTKAPTATASKIKRATGDTAVKAPNVKKEAGEVEGAAVPSRKRKAPSKVVMEAAAAMAPPVEGKATRVTKQKAESKEFKVESKEFKAESKEFKVESTAAREAPVLSESKESESNTTRKGRIPKKAANPKKVKGKAVECTGKALKAGRTT